MTYSDALRQAAAAKAARMPAFHIQAFLREAGFAEAEVESIVNTTFGWKKKTVEQQTIEMAERVRLNALIARL